ncbi:MAG: methyltransferase domain-containing protein [Hyphomonadaceae bacterium]|nr:methyltransferase domain-containing protein [Clostridia bacterium]
MSIIKCPVCGQPLEIQPNGCTCAKNHQYDKAKQGYCNLLLSNQRFSKQPGDSKEMVLSRKSFLSKGYYQPLADKLCASIAEYVGRKAQPYHVLDAGCGEGYYLDSIQKTMPISLHYTGFDISKEAVKQAAMRNKSITWLVAGSFHMPILTEQVDCLLHIFAPVCEAEFHRVVKQGGCVISVTPGKAHLYGLKQALYDQPYDNEEEEIVLDGFAVKCKAHIQYDIGLEHTEDIKNLLTMTPYFWRTNPDKIKALDELESLETPVHFIVTVYEKVE